MSRPRGAGQPISEPIGSRSKSQVKRVRAVAAGKERDWVLLEGVRLVLDALSAGHEPEVLLAEEHLELPGALAAHPQLRRVLDGLLHGVGELKTSPGVAALVRAPEPESLAWFAQAPPGIWLAVAGLQDPSNLGAAARAAEAAGAAGLLLAQGGVRANHPRAVRASMGSLLRLPRVAFTSADELRAPGLRHAVAATRDGQDYRTFDWSPPLVLWLGDERGASSSSPPPDAQPVTIPLHGPTESLNAATAAALLLFEAARSKR